MNHHRIALCCLVVGFQGAFGCGNVVSEPKTDLDLSDEVDTDTGPVDEPEIVEAAALSLADAASFEPAVQCYDRLPGESFLALSPEGELWLSAQNVDDALALRTLRADGTDSTRVEALGTPRAARAWSADRVDLIADSALWRLDDGGRTLLELPAASAGMDFCGDLTDRGLLLSDLEIFEARDLSWWRSGLVASSEIGLRILDLAGECVGTDNFTWLVADDGSLWRITPSRAEQVTRVTGVLAAAISARGVSAFTADTLWQRDEDSWMRFALDDFEAPALVSASAKDLWFHTPGLIARLNDETLETTAWSTAPSGLHAYDGGLWIESESEVCHVQGRHSIRVAGLIPFARSTDENVSFTVNAPGAAPLQAEVDGVPLATESDAPDSWSVTGVLPHIGWNRITLTADTESRTIPIKLLPAREVSYADDIAPLFQAHCASCHGVGSDTADLSTYDDWVDYASAIRARTVDSSNMPPVSQRSGEWGDDEVLLISEWLEGGMRP